jgi:nicotinamide-nucleotide adenylyltransferase
VVEPEGLDFLGGADIVAERDQAAPPRLAFLRRAPRGAVESPGTLLCLSASFNPLTTAHAALIEAASRAFPPSEVLLLLATVNVDKAVTGLPLRTRLALLEWFADPRPEISVGVVAHGRFVDKLQAIRRVYPADARVIFLLGFDTLVRLFDPKYYDDLDASLMTLFEGSEVIVANRGADGPSAIEAFLARSDVSPFAQRIHLVRLPDSLATVSATDVRARLAKGEPIAGLVPSEISAMLETWWRSRQRP